MATAMIGGCRSSTLSLSPKGLEQAGSGRLQYPGSLPRSGLIVAI
jgi:hypothetical protein